MQDEDDGSIASAADQSTLWEGIKPRFDVALPDVDGDFVAATHTKSTSTINSAVSDQSDGISVYQRVKAQLLQKQRMQGQAVDSGKTEGKNQGSATSHDELSQHTDDSDEENETSDEEEIRPHGRLARRMMAASAKEDVQGSNMKDDQGLSNDGRDSVANRAPVVNLADDHNLSTLNLDQIYRDSKCQPEQDKFKLLVEKKRKERLQREEDDNLKSMEVTEGGQLDNLSMDESNSERMTSTVSSRAPRGTGKSAREEISRETAKMARNMQLQHEPRVAKKFEKAILLDKFNFRKQVSSGAQSPAESDIPGVFDVVLENKMSSTTASSQEAKKFEPLVHNMAPFTFERDVAEETVDNADTHAEEPPIGQFKSQLCHEFNSQGKGKQRFDIVDAEQGLTYSKGKGKQRIDVSDSERMFKNNIPAIRVRKIKAAKPDDSDSDLEIADEISHAQQTSIYPSKQQDQSFTSFRVNASEPAYTSVRFTRQSNNKQKPPKRMTQKELDQLLKNKSRVQITTEREERRKELKAKGALLPTMEERANEIVEVENLVDKARREADEIRKKEKQAASKRSGDVYRESSDDESWNGSEEPENSDGDEEASVNGDIVKFNSISGESEEEDDDNSLSNQISAKEREQSVEEAETEKAADLSDDNHADDTKHSTEVPIHRHQRKARRVNIVYDDDEVDTEHVQGLLASGVEVQQTPNVHEKELRINIDMGTSSNGIGGLTQMFEGNSTAKYTSPKAQDADCKLSRLRNPYSGEDFQIVSPGNMNRNKVDAPLRVPPSMPADTYNFVSDENPHHEHSNSFYFANMCATQQSDSAEPIFDFSVHPSPELTPETPNIQSSAINPSGNTIDKDFNDSEMQVKRSRLYRKHVHNHHGKEHVPNAFDRMKIKPRNRQESSLEYAENQRKAQALVEEQAEESDDEYAGLGGRSDDENDENYSDVEDMIDHSNIKVSEPELAAFHA